MRAFEFYNRAITLEEATANAQSEVNKIVAAVKQNPENEDKVIQGFKAAIEAVRQIKSKIQQSKVIKTPTATKNTSTAPKKFEPIVPPSQQNQPELLAASLDEDGQQARSPEFMRLASTLAKEAAALNFMAQDSKALQKFIEQKMDEFYQPMMDIAKKDPGVRKELKAEFYDEFRKDIKKAKNELNQKIRDLVIKAEGLAPDTPFEKTAFDSVSKGIAAMLKTQVDALEEDDAEDAQSINAMLDQGIAGNIINMTKLISTNRGNIFDYINPELDPKVRATFDKIKRDIMTFVPPAKGSGNYGPAEVFLAMFGNPANKAKTAGDLIVGTGKEAEKFELKGSGYKKFDDKTNTGTGNPYGARLGAKAVNSADVAWEDFNKELMKIDPSLEETNPEKWQPESNQQVRIHSKTPGYCNYMSPNKNKDLNKWEYKKASRFNFNKSGLKLLNDEVLGPKSDKAKTTNLLKAILPKLIKGVQNIDGYDEQVESIVANDGTIDFDQFNKVYGGLAYASYQSGDDKIGKIMLINGHSGNYVIINGPKELQARIADKTISVEGGMTWNDDQQKATAQFAVR
jgi:hypothetical protein